MQDVSPENPPLPSKPNVVKMLINMWNNRPRIQPEPGTVERIEAEKAAKKKAVQAERERIKDAKMNAAKFIKVRSVVGPARIAHVRQQLAKVVK